MTMVSSDGKRRALWRAYVHELWSEVARYKFGAGAMIAAFGLGAAFLIASASGSEWTKGQAWGMAFQAGATLIGIGSMILLILLFIAPMRVYTRLRSELSRLRCENAVLRGDPTGSDRFHDLRCELAYFACTNDL